MESHWRAEWDESDELLSRGKISRKYANRLFRPNDIVIEKNDDGTLSASKMFPYPWEEDEVDVFQWGFNGKFMKLLSCLNPKGLFRQNKRDGKEKKKDIENEVTDIISLKRYPLRFADKSSSIYQMLCARGENFWKSRKKRLVCYREADEVDPSDVS
jgi:hypothetical protein